MSTLFEYSFLWATSGAIYMSVPQWLSKLVKETWSYFALRPKSANLTVVKSFISLIRMLSTKIVNESLPIIVTRFEIPMHDTFNVNICDCLQDTPHYFRRLLISKFQSLCLFLLDELSQLPATHQFHTEKYTISYFSDLFGIKNSTRKLSALSINKWSREYNLHAWNE